MDCSAWHRVSDQLPQWIWRRSNLEGWAPGKGKLLWWEIYISGLKKKSIKIASWIIIIKNLFELIKKHPRCNYKIFNLKWQWFGEYQMCCCGSIGGSCVFSCNRSRRCYTQHYEARWPDAESHLWSNETVDVRRDKSWATFMPHFFVRVITVLIGWVASGMLVWSWLMWRCSRGC